MFNRHDVAHMFGILQGVVFVAILVAIYLRWRADKNRDNAMEMKLDQLNAMFRSRGVRGASRPEGDGSGVDAGAGTGGGAGKKNDPAALGSAFPSWNEKSAAHDILGVQVSASEEEIERAYKTLLRQYHPDRFASWGKAYQQRAHYTVLTLQGAREKMLGKGRK